MKKFLCILVSVLLLFSLFPVSAAEKGKVSITGGPAEFRRGTTFDVEVELNRNPGFLSLRMDIAFDPLVLKVVRVTNTSHLPGFHYDIEEDGVILRYKKESGSNLNATGKLARIRFQVREDAIYGDSAISPVISQKLYDAQDSAGKAVPFDTVPLSFSLPCPHKNPALSILTEADFETEGTAEEICPDCGLVTPKALLPTLLSEDTKTKAILNIGEYQNKDKKTLNTQYLFATPEFEKAKEIFSDSLIRCFQVDFTKNSAPFSPEKACEITLHTDFELPEIIALYVITEEGARQIEVKKEETLLTFSYEKGTYAIVSREEEEPVIPEATAPAKTTAPEETKETNPENEAKRKELLLIGGGIFALFLCGGAALFLLRRRQDF